MNETRAPGTYRTPEGGIEVVVDLAESTSYVEDMFPDEVAAIVLAAVAAERARLRRQVQQLPVAEAPRRDYEWSGETATVVERSVVLALLADPAPEAGR